MREQHVETQLTWIEWQATYWGRWEQRKEGRTVICYLLFLFAQVDRCVLRHPAAAIAPISFIHVSTSAKQFDCLPIISFLFPYECQLFLILSTLRFKDKFRTAYPDNAHIYTYTHTYFHDQRHNPIAMSKKKNTQEETACSSTTVNSRRSVRIPSRFISVLSFQLLSRCINGSRVFPVCWLDKVCTEDEGLFMVH